MILSNKLAKGTPKKNLIPDFNNSGWFQDYTSAGGVVEVDKVNPHKMKLTTTQGAQARLIQVPVEFGKTYTLSFKTSTGLYRIYKSALRNHDDYKWLNKVNEKTGITFTVDASYGGYITLRFTAGSAGYYYFENFQLEEGSVATNFEPYKEVNRTSKVVPQKNKVLPFTSPKWQLHANAKVIDANTLELNATAANQFTMIDLYLKPNTNYTISMGQCDGIYKINDDKATAISATYNQKGTVTFNTGNTKKVTLFFYSASAGKFIFKKPMIEEGSTKTGYEEYKEGSNKASLVPNMNLLNPKAWVSGRTFDNAFKPTSFRVEGNNVVVVAPVNSMVSQVVDVKPNTNYTAFISYYPDAKRGIYVYSMNGTDLKPTGKGSPSTFNSGANTKVIIGLYKSSSANDLPEIMFDSPMMIEGSTQVPFEPYRLSAKKVNSPLVKAPYRNYPFKFKRENVEIFEGIQYGHNNPRIKNGGLFLEEYTFNLLSGKTFLPNNPTTIVDKGNYYLVTAGSTSNFQGAYLTGITVKAVTTYTLSAKVEELGSAKGKLDFVIEQTGGTTIRKKPVKFGDRYYITFTTGSGVTRISTCFYLGGGVIGDAFTLGKDVQLEERGYPTSPANGVHKADDLQIPVKFDTQGGSFEMEFDYHYSEGATQYLFDTNAEERWLIYKETYNSWIIYTNGVSRGYLSKNPVEGRNKLKLSWTATSFEVILNGEKVAGKAHVLEGRQNNIFLGQRYTIGSHLDDVIYSVVIKDHNGNIQFQF